VGGRRCFVASSRVRVGEQTLNCVRLECLMSRLAGWMVRSILKIAREACHASMPAEKLWLGVPDIDSSGVVVDLIQHYPECLCLTTMTSALYKHPPRYDSP